MKAIIVLFATTLLFSCGKTEESNKPGLEPKIPALNGQKEINATQMKAYMKKYESYSKYFKVGLTYTANEEVITDVQEQNGNTTKCQYKLSSTKSIVKIENGKVLSFVDNTYSDVTPACTKFFNSSQDIEKQDLKCFTDEDDMTQLPAGLKMYVGMYVGREHFYVEFTGQNQTFKGMIDPMRSSYEEMIASYTHVTGEFKYESSTTNSAFSEIDTSGIDIAAYPQVEVSCEDNGLLRSLISISK